MWGYRRSRLEVRVFNPADTAETRVAGAIKQQLTEGTFSLQGGIKLVREDQYREQFSEVAMLITTAEGYPASKLAMQEVLDRYPAFAESARHLQIINESLQIIEKTKNLKTLESRAEVVRTNQTAMFDALPFPIDETARAKQKESIDQIVREAIANLPPPKPRRKKAE
ncbi:hypothetical protein [Rhodoferax fermentans]|uniref:Uncharacterized protein n=1 Tax=Rhodoferax fermentans TaxID=28066 RepID=A0A1T1AP97_RHOFE|nr:hypothetical protein [Rhodoferax fermentans]MBK1683419.1 hypothetical protein [Rhodoferax fermentans]OOV05835.1 hypothetical protein RF819_03125 [Rhodoferax fermentans]